MSIGCRGQIGVLRGSTQKARRAPGVLAACVALLVFVAEWSHAIEPTVEPDRVEIHDGGTWRTHVRAGDTAQQWSLDAVRTADNELRGRITVKGSPVLEEANVEGRLSGKGLRGVLVDDDGAVLVEFSGTVGAKALWGTYRDRTGDEGSWYWEGQLGK